MSSTLGHRDGSRTTKLKNGFGNFGLTSNAHDGGLFEGGSWEMADTEVRTSRDTKSNLLLQLLSTTSAMGTQLGM